MRGKKFLLILILLICNLNLAMGFGIIYNLFISLFSLGKNDNGNGQEASEPSIPTPVPILRANLTTNVCGPQVSSCPKTRYRSINGSCNNLKNPGWGTAQTTYLRLLPNRYSDGIFKLPRTVAGKEMPNAREISIKFFKDKITNDLQLNLNGMQFGQIITHDMSLLASATGEVGKPFVCCQNDRLTPAALTNEFCAPVIVPLNDPIHKPGTCLEFVRADTDRHVGCVPKNKEANQISTVTPYLDLSIVYGSTDEVAAKLRCFVNGKLKTVPRHGREWPPQAENVTETCAGAESPKEPCYFGGDTRINQNTELTLLQIVWLSNHNNIADGLSEINPHWGDEKLYQESRRINIAEYQHIVYYEYLRIILGEENMLANKLIGYITKDNMTKYINDYDPTLVPGVINEHANAAWRYLHSLIKGDLFKKLEDRSNAGTLRLSDWLNRPSVLEVNNTFEELVFGFTAQPSSINDPFFSVEITEYLFRGKNKFGGDLRATDVQRGRDVGLCSYQDARAACNLTVPRTIEDLEGIIPKPYIKLLKEYSDGDVRNLELVVAGSLERHVPGALAGPTFLCIFDAQFFRTRVTDKHWHENGSVKNIALKPVQLASIRGVTMASIFCATTEVGTMQRKAFEVITADNPVVSCDEIPAINLNLWKDNGEDQEENEYGGTHGATGSQCM